MGVQPMNVATSEVCDCTAEDPFGGQPEDCAVHREDPRDHAMPPDPFGESEELPDHVDRVEEWLAEQDVNSHPVAARPITGNGVEAIRKWVRQVGRHFGGQSLATNYYASLVGYEAHLKHFIVTASDRELAREYGMHRSRLAGHAQRLVDAGFLMQGGERVRGAEKPRFTLAVPDVSASDDPSVPW